MQLNKTTFQITQNLSHYHEMNETVVNQPRPHIHVKQYLYYHPTPRIPSQKQTNALLISLHTNLLLQDLHQRKMIQLISNLLQEVQMTLLAVKRGAVLLSVLVIKVKPCYDLGKHFCMANRIFIFLICIQRYCKNETISEI